MEILKLGMKPQGNRVSELCWAGWDCFVGSWDRYLVHNWDRYLNIERGCLLNIIFVTNLIEYKQIHYYILILFTSYYPLGFDPYYHTVFHIPEYSH